GTLQLAHLLRRLWHRLARAPRQLGLVSEDDLLRLDGSRGIAHARRRLRYVQRDASEQQLAVGQPISRAGDVDDPRRHEYLSGLQYGDEHVHRVPPARGGECRERYPYLFRVRQRRVAAR